jgi:hypothetical protein
MTICHAASHLVARLPAAADVREVFVLRGRHGIVVVAKAGANVRIPSEVLTEAQHPQYLGVIGVYDTHAWVRGRRGVVVRGVLVVVRACVVVCGFACGCARVCLW